MRHDSSKIDTSPLFHADSATLVFAAQKDGKIRVTGHCISDYLSVAPGHAFEVRWGPQGVEGRVVPRIVPLAVDDPDPFWVPDVASGIVPKLPTLSAVDIASIKSAGGPVLVVPRIGLTYDQTGGE